MKGNDVAQLLYSKKTGLSMRYLEYKNYSIVIKNRFFNRKLVINACCIEHLLDICEAKNYNVISINTLD